MIWLDLGAASEDLGAQCSCEANLGSLESSCVWIRRDIGGSGRGLEEFVITLKLSAQGIDAKLREAWRPSEDSFLRVELT